MCPKKYGIKILTEYNPKSVQNSGKNLLRLYDLNL